MSGNRDLGSVENRERSEIGVQKRSRMHSSRHLSRMARDDVNVKRRHSKSWHVRIPFSLSFQKYLRDSSLIFDSQT